MTPSPRTSANSPHNSWFFSFWILCWETLSPGWNYCLNLWIWFWRQRKNRKNCPSSNAWCSCDNLNFRLQSCCCCWPTLNACFFTSSLLNAFLVTCHQKCRQEYLFLKWSLCHKQFCKYAQFQFQQLRLMVKWREVAWPESPLAFCDSRWTHPKIKMGAERNRVGWKK